MSGQLTTAEPATASLTQPVMPAVVGGTAPHAAGLNFAALLAGLTPLVTAGVPSAPTPGAVAAGPVATAPAPPNSTSPPPAPIGPLPDQPAIPPSAIKVGSSPQAAPHTAEAHGPAAHHSAKPTKSDALPGPVSPLIDLTAQPILAVPPPPSPANAMVVAPANLAPPPSASGTTIIAATADATAAPPAQAAPCPDPAASTKPAATTQKALPTAAPSIATTATPDLASLATTAPNSTTTTTTTTPPTHSTPPAATQPAAEQVSPALLRLASDAQGGRMTLQLNPHALGSVAIEIARPVDGHVQVSLTAERPETLALLQQDSTQLGHALDRAGISSENRSISFHLTPPPSTSADTGTPIVAATAQQNAALMSGSNGSGQGFADPRSNASPRSFSFSLTDDGATEPQLAAIQAAPRSGLNITA